MNVTALDSFIDENSGGEYADAAGTLNPTELTVSPAPEPASWLLMIAGVGAVGWRLRRAGTRLVRLSTGLRLERL